MKSSKAEIVTRVHTLPEVTFDDHRLTSFSGLVLFIALFKRIDLLAGLRRCFDSTADRALLQRSRPQRGGLRRRQAVCGA